MTKKAIIIIISLVVAIGIGATAYTVSTGVFNPYEQQIRLGYKFLSEMNYEQALIAFDKAISIEAKRDKAYIGKADTYFAKGNEDMTAVLMKIDEGFKTGDDMLAMHDESAKIGNEMLVMINESLKVGYELTQSEKIIDTYIRLADKFTDIGRTDLALKLLQLGYNTIGNERLKDRIDKVTSSFLKVMFDLFEAGNVDEARNRMSTFEFEAIASLASETEPMFYSPTSSSTLKSGKGIGIYRVQGQDFYTAEGWYFVYYGDYADNVRSGHGIFLANWFTFEGQWQNDKPNGQGKETHGYGNEIHRTVEATYQDGFYNGQVIDSDTVENEICIFKYFCADGIPTKIDGTVLVTPNGDMIAYTYANEESGRWHREYVLGGKMGLLGYEIPGTYPEYLQ